MSVKNGIEVKISIDQLIVMKTVVFSPTVGLIGGICMTKSQSPVTNNHDDLSF